MSCRTKPTSRRPSILSRHDRTAHCTPLIMRHLREFLVLVGLLGLMFLLARLLDLLVWLLPLESDLRNWISHGSWFAVGVGTGVLAVRLSTWHFRTLVTIVIPVLATITYSI